MLTLTVETGAGVAGANSYASEANGTAYHEAHLYATAWTNASSPNRAAALAMATRLIDEQFQFFGRKATATQGLQWPRRGCPDPDGVADGDGLVAADIVPKGVVEATCEMARELLVLDRTTAAPGEGENYHFTAAASIGYNKADARPVITKVAQAMLCKYGALIPLRRSSVHLIRC